MRQSFEAVLMGPLQNPCGFQFDVVDATLEVKVTATEGRPFRTVERADCLDFVRRYVVEFGVEGISAVSIEWPNGDIKTYGLEP